MPGIDDTREVRATNMDQASDSKSDVLDRGDLESFAYRLVIEGRVPELLDLLFENTGGLTSDLLGSEPHPGIQAAYEAYRNWKQSQGGDMHTDVRPTERERPQTIPREYAGKWIAWSEDGLRIVAVGGSFDDCERLAVDAGFAPNRVGIMHVQIGRYRLDD
jgi:hypothetical protein